VTLGGDYLSPSPIGTARVDGQPLAGRQMVDVLNAAGLQWATLGNHEFDGGEAVLRARLEESRFGVVTTNVTDLGGALFPKTVSSAVVPLRIGGRTIRIGLIGLTIDTPPRPWVRYLNPIDTARNEVARMRGRTDAIIALTHLSLAEDKALVEAVPDIDLVIGGHEHENVVAHRGVGFTPIVKADANARSAAVVSLTFTGTRQRPEVASRLQVLDARIPPKPSVDRLVKRWVETALEGFRKDGFNPTRVIAAVPDPLDGRETAVRNGATNLTDLILASMAREAAMPDVTILNAGSIRIDDVLPAGPVTEYDLIRLLPFGGTVVTASLTGEVLSEVLDAGRTNLGIGGYLHVFGAVRTASGWTVGGNSIDRAARYRVAMPEFLLTGGEARMGFLTRTNPQVQDVKALRDIRFAVADELRRRFPM
jgi:5'-nucleotidase